MDFAAEHPEVFAPWHAESNWLVIVAVPDEASLRSLAERAKTLGIVSTLVEEPDLDNQATALALEPGEPSRRLCSSLPLFGREATMV